MGNYQLMDKALRGILISAAEKIETALQNSNGPMNLNTFVSPMGLRIDVQYETKENGPTIYKFNYSLDTAKFRDWLKENAFLCDGGPMMFTTKGIQVIVQDANDWAFALLGVDNEDGKFQELPLMKSTITFTVNKDIFNGKDWTVMIMVPDGVSLDRSVSEVPE